MYVCVCVFCWIKWWAGLASSLMFVLSISHQWNRSACGTSMSSWPSICEHIGLEDPESGVRTIQLTEACWHRCRAITCAPACEVEEVCPQLWWFTGGLSSEIMYARARPVMSCSVLFVHVCVKILKKIKNLRKGWHLNYIEYFAQRAHYCLANCGKAAPPVLMQQRQHSKSYLILFFRMFATTRSTPSIIYTQVR
jgi:hypothetical protein